MSLTKTQQRWVVSAVEAFTTAEKGEGLLMACGRELREMFASVEAMREAGSYETLRKAFQESYEAQGGKAANVPSYWARICFQYAWPGTGKASGKYYKLEDDGSVSLDKERNLSATPPPSATRAPRFLRDVPHITPAEVAEFGGFPMRLIVAAGSGGGKTTFVRQMVRHMLDVKMVEFVLVITGTLVSHWDELGGAGHVEVMEFAGDYGRLEEVIAVQKEQVRENPKKPELWGRPLIVLDDLGAEKSARKGEGGQLVDELFLTLRNFGLSVILLSQQQNNLLTPARRDGATSILVGDLTNKQREAVFDTLSIPPDQLKKAEFVSWCAGSLGRANDYHFLAFLKEAKRRQLFLTRACIGGEDEEDVARRYAEEELGGGGGGGGGGGSPVARYAPRERAEVEEDAEEPVRATKQWGTFKQGGSQQVGARDLYTTQPATIEPLLDVLASRHEPGDLMWEPCVGLKNISSVLEGAGYSVVETDLFAPDGTLQPEQSFIDCEMEGVACSACPVPNGVKVIVTNPPFSEKLAFVQRIYELGLPTYLLLPVETLGHKGCARLFEEHGGVELFFLSGKAASVFHKVSEGRDVSVGACAWFGFNTRTKKEHQNNHHFLL